MTATTRTAAPAAPGPPWVWMYHSIADSRPDPYRVTVGVDRFAAQLDWLRRRGLRGVSVGELLSARARGRAAGLVGLSFDDGYRDFAEHALPLLARHGFTATVYVLAGRLGGRNAWDAEGPRKPLLTAEQVRTVADHGMEVGSHGLHHVDLRAAAPGELAAETGRSRALLQELTGRPVRGFCYPYGAYDARVAAAVREAGYDHACAVRVTGRPARFSLPRAYIGDRDAALRLRAKRALHRLRSGRRPSDA